MNLNSSCELQNDALLSGQAFEYEKIRTRKGTLGLRGIKRISSAEIGEKGIVLISVTMATANRISSRLSKTIFLPEVVMKN